MMTEIRLPVHCKQKRGAGMKSAASARCVRVTTEVQTEVRCFPVVCTSKDCLSLVHAAKD